MILIRYIGYDINNSIYRIVEGGFQLEQQWLPEERLFVNAETRREGSASGRRYFSRGGVKFALLELLSQEPMHGYQMMKALEEQSGGLYKPSAGTIYPTLQMLRDQGFISSAKQSGKQVFSITEDGAAFLQQEREAMDQQESEATEGIQQPADIKEENEKTEAREEKQHAAHVEQDGNAEAQADEHDQHQGHKRNRRLTPAGRELLHLLKAAERAAISDGDKAVQFRFILNQLRNSLYELLEEEES